MTFNIIILIDTLFSSSSYILKNIFIFIILLYKLIFYYLLIKFIFYQINQSLLYN
jgi:hypothetical protein